MEKLNVMNYNIFVGDLEKICLKEKKIINTINPHSYITAKKDYEFKRALEHSDLIIPDGAGIVIAAKKIKKKKIKKLAGLDLHNFLLEEMNKKSGKIFYMGSKDSTLKRIKDKIKIEYPNIKVMTFSPPFKEKLSEIDNLKIISKINDFNPDILFVGMTAPKQEKWLHENKDRINFKVASGIGAAFDFYAGTVKRSQQFWIDMQLEWLPRLLNDPKRLWKRNFISTPLFLLDIYLYKLKIKK